ncbi:TPA: hypothetical protein ACK3JH_002298, partial [Mannheimia haemolytica]
YIKNQHNNISNLIFFVIFIVSIILLTILLYFSDVGKYNKFFISVFTFPLEGLLWGVIILCYLMVKTPVSYFAKLFSDFFVGWVV